MLPTLPMGSLLVGCFQTGDDAPLSQHLPVDSSEWSLGWIHECAIKIMSRMKQGSPSFQGFSVLKGTFPELCGSLLLLLFVAFDDSVNFWMLQFLQMGLIVIVTWLEIQQKRESGDLCYFCLLASQWVRLLCLAGSSSYLTVLKHLEQKLSRGECL